MRRAHYPCQNVTGLPVALADAVALRAALTPHRVAHRCYETCEAIIREVGADVRMVGGYAHLDPATAPQRGARIMDGIIHWWLEWGGRIIDPTRQQLGRGAVTYWRAIPDYQGGDGWTFHGAAWRVMDAEGRGPGCGRRLIATLCEPEPCYQDQGWRDLRRRAV